MKQYTTFNKACGLLAIASILLIGYTASANITNTLPVALDFQPMGNGVTIVGANGWYAEADAYATGTNADYSFSGTPPIGPTNGGAYVILNTDGGVLTNRFDASTNVWVELMLNATQRADDEDLGTMTNDCKVLAYVSTNDELVVYHTEGTGWSPLSVGGNRFTTFTGTTIGTNDWIRLSISFDFTTDAGGLGKFFKLVLNGTELTSPYGVNDLTDTDPFLGGNYGGINGPWHLIANHAASPSTVSNLALFGTASFDDFIVTLTDPFGGYRIMTSISPLKYASWASIPNPDFQVTAGTSTSVVITVSNYWDIVAVTNNGSPVAVASNVTLPNVSADHTITFTLSPQETNSPAGNVDVPLWWLAEYSTNNLGLDPDYNDDNDDLADWQEWLASTDPLVSNKFEIIDHYITGGTGVVVWVSSDKIDPDLPPFQVLRSTDLTASGGVWTNVYQHARTNNTAGTNVWTDPAPPDAGVPAFYRVSATN